MELIFLGIGSNSFQELGTSSMALRVSNDECILIDCGPATLTDIAKAGMRLSDINTVILTHRHLDHCLGLPYLLFGRNLEAMALTRQDPSRRPAPLQIIAEQETWAALFDLFRYCHPDVPKFAYEISTHDIRSLVASPVQIGEAIIQTIAVDHAVPAYGILVSQNDRKMFAYSSDTLLSEDFLAIASGAKVLVHEAMVPSSEAAFSRSAKHSTSADAGEAVRRVVPEQAFLMHLRPVFLSRVDELQREASAVAGRSVHYPQEGSIIQF